MFDEVLPYYLSIGMSYEDFWYGDLEMAIHYRRADELRRQRKNAEAWNAGAYVLCAIDAALGGEEHPYPTRPFPMTRKEIEEREREELRERAAAFEAYADAMNRKIREKRGGEEA